jgi:hypothetical protein
MFKSLILSGKFKEAREMAEKMTVNELTDSLLELAYETDGMMAYTFVNYLICSAGEDSDLHYLASLLLSQPLCHFDGAYKAALYHARKALELSSNDTDLKVYLLFFHDIPDKLVSKEEAVRLAQDILIDDPENQIAKRILHDYGY